ncbi:hypothetical protein [Bacillus thermotolerans]|uniref:Uncharacterized protein n=1 Tax=Bacillus thermotolerans TaxID=1221996 RepID=A0A0F5HMU3_BACTR|nr:hypothetical protein [Bacillus thermotolerans]KKB34704.1 hypothetical protein QY95_03816 [Bacillus thermotolerans]KKB38781.1 hypothetical protein QY96_02908 [Bacillus thermotolerans]
MIEFFIWICILLLTLSIIFIGFLITAYRRGKKKEERNDEL